MASWHIISTYTCTRVCANVRSLGSSPKLMRDRVGLKGGTGDHVKLTATHAVIVASPCTLTTNGELARTAPVWLTAPA